MTYNMNQIMTNDKEQRIKRMDRDMNCEVIHDGKLFGNSFMTSRVSTWCQTRLPMNASRSCFLRCRSTI